MHRTLIAGLALVSLIITGCGTKSVVPKRQGSLPPVKVASILPSSMRQGVQGYIPFSIWYPATIPAKLSLRNMVVLNYQQRFYENFTAHGNQSHLPVDAVSLLIRHHQPQVIFRFKGKSRNQFLTLKESTTNLLTPTVLQTLRQETPPGHKFTSKKAVHLGKYQAIFEQNQEGFSYYNQIRYSLPLHHHWFYISTNSNISPRMIVHLLASLQD